MDFKNDAEQYWLILFEEPFSNDHNKNKYYETMGPYDQVILWMKSFRPDIKDFRMVPWPDSWGIKDACIHGKED